SRSKTSGYTQPHARHTTPVSFWLTMRLRRKMRVACLFLIAVAIQLEPSLAQHTHGEKNSSQQPAQDSMLGMPGMSEPHMNQQNMTMESHSLIELLQHHATAGTDAQPNSTPSPMLMTTRGKW